MKKQKMRKIGFFFLAFVLLLSGMPMLQIDAAESISYFEGFEDYNNLTNNWSATSGTPSTTTEQAYSGLYSYKLDESKEVIQYNFGEAQQGVMTLYMYDNGKTGKYTSAIADVVGTTADGSAAYMQMGIRGEKSKTHYVISIDGTYSVTTVERTVGWHKLTWDFSDSETSKMYIDDSMVYERDVATSFVSVKIGDYWAQNNKYDDICGMYFDHVAMGTPVVSINDVKYGGTLETAIEAAKEGDTIKLLDSIVYTGDLTIGEKITLDLNGKTLTASSLATFDGNVIDDSNDKTGLLIVGKNDDGTPKCSFSIENDQMPVYNGEGYVFATITPQELDTSVAGTDTFELVFKPLFGETINNLLANSSVDTKISFRIRLDWVKDEIPVTPVYLEYTDEMVQQVYGNGMAFSIKASGVSKYDGLTITPLLISDQGAEWSNGSFSNFE